MPIPMASAIREFPVTRYLTSTPLVTTVKPPVVVAVGPTTVVVGPAAVAVAVAVPVPKFPHVPDEPGHA